MSATIEPIRQENLAEARAFLSRHEETSQFLLNNLREYGPALTSHPNSGNFRLIRENDAAAGVFCLTRRGNLLAQASPAHAGLILESCLSEPVPLRGFVGDWDSVEPVHRLFQSARPGFRAVYESKEILYRYALSPADESLRHDPRVRCLKGEDFPQWLEFTRMYLNELSLPDDLTDQEKEAQFRAQAAEGIWWGLFSGATLLSRVALNSRGEAIGQVGGVFTRPDQRKNGLARAAMLHMLKDCRDRFGHRKSILFTGQTDFPAQKLYESMGYQRIGYFGLILGAS